MTAPGQVTVSSSADAPEPPVRHRPDSGPRMILHHPPGPGTGHRGADPADGVQGHVEAAPPVAIRGPLGLARLTHLTARGRTECPNLDGLRRNRHRAEVRANRRIFARPSPPGSITNRYGCRLPGN